MSQFDLFGDPIAEAPAPAADPFAEVRAEHAAAIAALPEKLRPQCASVGPVPSDKPQLEAFYRVNQRLYLLWLIGAIARGVYRTGSEANAPYVLMKLNGLGGEW
ncbi:hypothetical protein [Paraburkholderia sp. BL17N1]|uniref:hypothetical protein n=1 Tax=Paraburkholderia sp. BL17N1 TaxID=1938798 RepID=UPI000EB2CF2B|nr:hypothetical protein [Paraburkholderia sp. BL17N1]RKR46260.1 hypothetical protein B0G82_3942 [Paraburkholderia sp. BL17N1]